jgi:hypothetical protein
LQPTYTKILFVAYLNSNVTRHSVSYLAILFKGIYCILIIYCVIVFIVYLYNYILTIYLLYIEYMTLAHTT